MILRALLKQHCDHSEGHSKAELAHHSMATIQGNSRLEILPIEVLNMVLRELAPAGTDLEGHEAEQKQCDDLLRICLVSKTMDAIARRLLYQDIRLCRLDAMVYLLATFYRNPSLTGLVRSVFFSPDEEDDDDDVPLSCILDLTPMCSHQDPDYAFWTAGRVTAKARMSPMTREQVIYTMFYKVLSRTSALQSLYFKLPSVSSTIGLEHRTRFPYTSRRGVHLQKLKILFEEFFLGHAFSSLANLSTVGILEDIHRPMTPSTAGLLRKLFSLPGLQKAVWSNLKRPVIVHGVLWPSTWPSIFGPSTNLGDGVKRVELRYKKLRIGNVISLKAAFPCLESFTIVNCVFVEERPTPSNHPLFRVLGEFQNLHTLELDSFAECFIAPITTASGPSTLLNLSDLSALHTLVVPADVFIRFVRDEKELRIEGLRVVLPGSLRCLTLVLTKWFQLKLRRSGHGMMRHEIIRVFRVFLQEFGPTLLEDFPHLEKIGLCYQLMDYRQHDVYCLVPRATTYAEEARWSSWVVAERFGRHIEEER
ncbi:hypothetical protein N8I77_009726 [Diaporthe amygdali]|uniref:Uncharacterized protein n=1 Tax=Phomopsis amygdali TaxID=1214568 RepID=A0AAD9SBM9_PHOAM|nr:hypothetical protein N8I77_009726 [Diaporthe amygdali]